MEEPAEQEEPTQPSPESVSVDSASSPEPSTTNALNESSSTDIMSLDAPKQCESQDDCQGSKDHSSPDVGGESGGEDHRSPDEACQAIDAPKQCESGDDCQGSKDHSSPDVGGESGGKVAVAQPPQSHTNIESPGSPPKPLEASPVEYLESSKSGPDGGIGAESPPPSELGSESLKISTLPLESGVESPKSPYPLESSLDSPKSIASNESGESDASDAKSLDSSQSQKSGTSSEFVRRKSKLMESYSIKRPSKLNQLETQLELVASEREKDVIVKQGYKVQEESLKEKRESIIKQMHKEERKAQLERKASTKAGTSFRVDLNASRRDSRKDDLNRKKEEDERNKQLLLQRARDEKNLRKSIYHTGSKTPSQTSSPNSSSPTSSLASTSPPQEPEKDQ
ncbi:unnamed protein product [Calypogeia fissa]